MPRIVFKDGHPVKARPTILLQVNSARSTTPPPTLSASHRHPADLKRKTLDFGQLPSAAAARRQDSSDSGPSRTAASQHGTVKLSRFGSDPAAQPALREQLAQGLVNEPLGPEPESPWKISAPLQQQPASKGPTFFQLQHPATTKIIKAEPAAQDSSAHAEADAAASTLPRTAQSACGPEVMQEISCGACMQIGFSFLYMDDIHSRSFGMACPGFHFKNACTSLSVRSDALPDVPAYDNHSAFECHNVGHLGTRQTVAVRPAAKRFSPTQEEASNTTSRGGSTR